jgi:hypothetical protein
MGGPWGPRVGHGTLGDCEAGKPGPSGTSGFWRRYLSPRIIEAIAEGRAPIDLTAAKLVRNSPTIWANQEKQLGWADPTNGVFLSGIAQYKRLCFVTPCIIGSLGRAHRLSESERVQQNPEAKMRRLCSRHSRGPVLADSHTGVRANIATTSIAEGRPAERREFRVNLMALAQATQNWMSGPWFVP